MAARSMLLLRQAIMAKTGSASFSVFVGVALIFALIMVATRNTQGNQ